MEVCKYCGREIPEGRICTCPQAKKDAENNMVRMKKIRFSDQKTINPESVNHTEIHKEKQNFYENAESAKNINSEFYDESRNEKSGFREDNKINSTYRTYNEEKQEEFQYKQEISAKEPKLNKKTLLGAALLGIIFIAAVSVLIVYIAGAGYKSSIKNFMNAVNSKDSAAFMECIYPEEIINETDESKKAEYKKTAEEEMKNFRIKINGSDEESYSYKIISNKAMSTEILKEADEHLKTSRNIDIKFNEGFIVETEIENDAGKTETVKFYLIKADSQFIVCGWKTEDEDAENKTGEEDKKEKEQNSDKATQEDIQSEINNENNNGEDNSENNEDQLQNNESSDIPSEVNTDNSIPKDSPEYFPPEVQRNPSDEVSPDEVPAEENNLEEVSDE